MNRMIYLTSNLHITTVSDENSSYAMVSFSPTRNFFFAAHDSSRFRGLSIVNKQKKILRFAIDDCF